jgi:hypothetical protein
MCSIGELVTFSDVVSLLEGNTNYMKGSIGTPRPINSCLESNSISYLFFAANAYAIPSDSNIATPSIEGTYEAVVLEKRKKKTYEAVVASIIISFACRQS